MSSRLTNNSLGLPGVVLRDVAFFPPDAGPGVPAAGTFSRGSQVRILRSWKGKTDEWSLVEGDSDISQSGWIPRTHVEPVYQLSSHVNAVNDLGIRLLRTISKDGQDAIVCPYGLGRMAAVLVACSGGETREKLEPLADTWPIRKKSKTFSSSQFTSTDFVLHRIGFRLTRDFQNFARQFHIGLQESEFDESARLALNQQVTDLTIGMVRDLFSPAEWTPDLKIVACNVSSFIGKWDTAFSTGATTDRPFHVNQTDCITVKMMEGHLCCRTLLIPDLDAEAVVLPLARGQEAGVIILPNMNKSINQVMNDLTSSRLASAIRDSNEERVELFLPRFSVESSLELTKCLPELHPLVANAANLSGLSRHPELEISRGVQQSRIEVAEEGVEAASITAVQFCAASTNRESIVRKITVNRPFLFFLVSTASGSHLFSSVVSRPSSVETSNSG